MAYNLSYVIYSWLTDIFFYDIQMFWDAPVLRQDTLFLSVIYYWSWGESTIEVFLKYCSFTIMPCPFYIQTSWLKYDNLTTF